MKVLLVLEVDKADALDCPLNCRFYNDDSTWCYLFNESICNQEGIPGVTPDEDDNFPNEACASCQEMYRKTQGEHNE